jgi:selenocysteine-specific elongation factor
MLRSTLMHLTGLPASLLSLPDTALTIALHGKAADDAVIVLRRHWEQMRAQIVSTLQQFHARMPDEQGPDAARLRRIAAPLLPEALWRALVDALIGEGVVVRSGAWLHLPEHAVLLDAGEEVLAAKLFPLIARGRFDPPWVRDLASATQEPEEKVRQLLRKLARRGEVCQVVRDLFYHPDVVRELAGLVAALAQQHGGALGASAFRDASGLGRKRAIQILEFFDRVGYTRFQGDLRLVRADSRLLEAL